jgi:predicted ATPase
MPFTNHPMRPPLVSPSPCSPPQPVLFGRQDVLARLLSRVHEQRLVSVVGAGGVGKTALAQAALSRLRPGWFTDVRLIQLQSLTQARDIVPQIATALGLTTHVVDTWTTLGAGIGTTRRLLVLDTCERLIDAVAVTVERLLRLAPRLHILTTSREALRAQGEHIVRVLPLELPMGKPACTEAHEVPAIQLFLERIGRPQHCALAHTELPAMLRLCRRLDGLPLAIELAARSSALYGMRMLRTLTRDPLARLQLPGAPHDCEPRQQTLRATLDWSYGLLTPAEQVVLQRLSVYEDSFDEGDALAVLAAAASAPSELLDSVSGLIGKSLVNAQPSAAGHMRWRLLTTTRAYALEKLEASGEHAKIERRRRR